MLLERVAPSRPGVGTALAGRQAGRQAGNEGITLLVRLTPCGSGDSVEGLRLVDDRRQALSIKVRAPARDNQANEVLIALLADHLKLAKRDIRIAGGHSSRHNPLHLSGEPELLSRKFEDLADGRG